ncbi:AraC family transcriptional regulator [Cohnella yongneupensis]|uniref:Helix-turn-helix transcriptional regulator n=1 Tax=Cohnella yongneupensis TaxID=425006 RepID=A0ABW0R2E6_9BACL
MKLYTVGNAIYPGYIHPIYCTNTVDPDIGLHQLFRLFIVFNGNGTYSYGGHTYPLMAPTIFCLNAGESLHLQPESAITASTVLFHPNVINDSFGLALPHPQDWSSSIRDQQDLWYLDPFNRTLLPLSSNTPAIAPVDPQAATYVSQLIDMIAYQLSWQPDQHWPCRSRSILSELLSIVHRLTETTVSSGAPIPNLSHSQIQPVIDYLHLNYVRKIKIEELTKLFHTNKTTLNNQFKSATGLSIIAYLNAIRMQAASFMLRSTLLPSDEIMIRVGIQDSSHFTRTFRKHAGCTPAEFRNLHCRMIQ